MHAGNGVHFFNTLTGNRYDEKAQLDLNLDGVFDDRDKEVFYDFNFAVLASSSSFSSANTMPIMCKDNGVCVLGEKSKGGACAVVFPFTPESHFLSLSGPLRTVSETGLDVDKGAPVDYELVETKTITDESGEQQKKSYSKLYDLGLVGSLRSERTDNRACSHRKHGSCREHSACRKHSVCCRHDFRKHQACHGQRSTEIILFDRHCRYGRRIRFRRCSARFDFVCRCSCVVQV